MKNILALILLLCSIQTMAQNIDDSGFGQSLKFPVFAAASGTFTAAAAPTTVCSIFGSSTKLLYVYKVRVNTTQTTAGNNTWFLLKKSAIDGGGTSTNLVRISLDSGVSNVDSGASVKTWTVNPALPGASLGAIRVASIFAPAAATASGQSPYEFDFTPNGNWKPIVLRSAAEGVALSFQGVAAPAGLSVSCDFLWGEARP